MTRILTAGAAAALATFATFAALPAAHAATSTTTVQIADLDLASAEGQAKLDARIARAAREVCKDAVTGSRIARVDAECVAKTRAQFDRQVAARRSGSRIGG